MEENKKRSIAEEKVWMKYFPKEALEAKLPELTIHGYLRDLHKDHLDDIAIHYYGTDITYRSLFEKIDQCANSFTALGVKQGDMVSLLTAAVPESIAALYALNKIGATANTIDPRMDVESIRRMICESGSEILITIDLAFPKVEKIISKINQKKIIVNSASSSLPFFKKVAMKFMSRTDIPYGPDILKWDSFIECGKGTVAPEAPYVGDATVSITYTGGTTGFPKGVMLTNDSMNAVSINFRYAGLQVKPGERFLGIIPMFTSYGMVCGLHMPLTLGLVLVPVPKFQAQNFGKLVRDFKPNHMISTPAFYEMMMESDEVKDLDLSFLITMGSGGDTMNNGLEQKLDQFMKSHNIKYPLAQGYGMSEVSAAASFCVNDIFKSGSVGIPSVMTTISIFDPESGEELGYGEEGEICITGPSMMKGYYLRKDETDYVMRKHADGQIWVHSGDVGMIDEDGFLFIKGRIKRMITRFDGHKVFPVMIESLVAAREDVRNCSVIGVDDMDRTQGQYPLVVVELAEGTDPVAACKAIFDECNENLEERGKPVGVVAVDAIPLTGAGKNDYRALEKVYKNYDYSNWSIL